MSIPDPIFRGSSIMWVRTIRKTFSCSSSTRSSRSPMLWASSASPWTNDARASLSISVAIPVISSSSGSCGSGGASTM